MLNSTPNREKVRVDCGCVTNHNQRLHVNSSSTLTFSGETSGINRAGAGVVSGNICRLSGPGLMF